MVFGRNHMCANHMGHGGITVQLDMHEPIIEMYCRDICVQIANLHSNDKVWCTLYIAWSVIHVTLERQARLEQHRSIPYK